MEYNDLVIFKDHNEFSKVINRCHNIIRDNEFCTPDIAFDELSKVIFCKLYDEKKFIKGLKKKLFFYALKEDSDNDVYSRIAGRDVVEENIGIYGEIKNDFKEIFSQNKKEIGSIGLKPRTLMELVCVLQKYNFTDTDLDIKGSTYQILIKETFTGGRGLGQFFTPREIVNFMVNLVKPTQTDLVIDPACGSGGFLVEIINYLSEKSDISNPAEHIYGVDANDKMAWTSQINMMIHNDGEGHIRKSNTLVLDDMDKYDLIFTNPPFGSRETNQNILHKFTLSKNKASQALEILFVEKCIDMLKENGKLCIILPDGILTNPSLKYVREFIMAKARIISIISLPEETFKPYGTSVKTSIIYLQKTSTSNNQGAVFMADVKNVGYDSTGRNTDISDFDAILEEHSAFVAKYYG